MTKTTTMRQNLLLVAALTAFATLVTACGGGTANMSLDPQLKEARTLNSELRAEWTQTEETLNTTLTQVEQFPAISVDASKVDMNLMQMALTEAFNTESKPAAEGDGKADCAKDAGDNMTSLKNYAKQVDEPVAKFINAKVKSVCSIKSNIKVRLPKMATEIGERYLTTKLKVEELKVKADSLKTTADSNPLLAGEQRAKFDSEYVLLQNEIAGIEELLATMETEVTTLPEKVRETLEKFTYALSNFGQGQ